MASYLLRVLTKKVPPQAIGSSSPAAGPPAARIGGAALGFVPCCRSSGGAHRRSRSSGFGERADRANAGGPIDGWGLVLGGAFGRRRAIHAGGGVTSKPRVGAGAAGAAQRRGQRTGPNPRRTARGPPRASAPPAGSEARTQAHVGGGNSEGSAVLRRQSCEECPPPHESHPAYQTFSAAAAAAAGTAADTATPNDVDLRGRRCTTRLRSTVDTAETPKRRFLGLRAAPIRARSSHRCRAESRALFHDLKTRFWDFGEVAEVKKIAEGDHSASRGHRPAVRGGKKAPPRSSTTSVEIARQSGQAPQQEIAIRTALTTRKEIGSHSTRTPNTARI